MVRGVIPENHTQLWLDVKQFISLHFFIEKPKSLSYWIPKTPDSETKIWMHLVYLGGVPGKAQ